MSKTYFESSIDNIYLINKQRPCNHYCYVCAKTVSDYDDGTTTKADNLCHASHKLGKVVDMI